MKKYICLLLLLHVFPLFGGDGTGALRERIYLHTDKQIYIAGELLWMKVLTVDADKMPLAFSKIAYVELLDAQASHAQIKIALTGGTGDGWMVLPADLPTGYYRIIAYTRYMRNETPEIYFEKNIGVVNLFQSTFETIKDTSNHLPLPGKVKPANTCSLSTDKTLYTTRTKGVVTLDGLPANAKSLSISIAGKDIVPAPGANNIMDWSRQPFPSNRTFSNTFLPEYEGHIITGKIIDTQNEAIRPTTQVTPFLSFPGGDIRMFVGQADSAANVLFFTSYISGVHEIATATYNLSEKKYRVDIQSPFIWQHTPKQLPALRFDSVLIARLLERSVDLQVLYAFTGDSLEVQPFQDSYFKNDKRKKIYPLDDYVRFGTMAETVTELIPWVRFRKNNDRQQLETGNRHESGTPLILVDGIPVMDHDIIYRYDPNLVKEICHYPGTYSFGGYPFAGIISFSTYRHNYPDLATGSSVQVFSYEGTQVHRQFYVPDYADEHTRKSRLPDRRHTLAWNPDIPTGGKSSVRIPFCTSDLTGKFQVTIEGLTTDGNVVYATADFEVDD